MRFGEFINKPKIAFGTVNLLDPTEDGICKITLPSGAKFVGAAFDEKSVTVTGIFDDLMEPKVYFFKLVDDMESFHWAFDLEYIGTAYPVDFANFRICHVFLKK